MSSIGRSGTDSKNGLVILAVVAFNALIGFVREFRAGKVIEALSRAWCRRTPPVLRDGRKATLPATEAVGLEKWLRRRARGSAR